MLKYPALILDHDDTVVNSSPRLHYPAFVDNLAVLRPKASITFAEFMGYCLKPGFNGMCREVFGFNDEEVDYQFEKWCEYIENHIPDAFEGMRDILQSYKKRGGNIFVVSHSLKKNILRDYRENSLPEPLEVFGWDLPEEKRKPAAYPLEEIMRRYGFKPEEMLMVDDLKHGYEMAEKCGVDFACAAWSYSIDDIAAYMRGCGKYYLEKVEELKDVLEL